MHQYITENITKKKIEVYFFLVLNFRISFKQIQQNCHEILPTGNYG